MLAQLRSQSGNALPKLSESGKNIIFKMSEVKNI